MIHIKSKKQRQLIAQTGCALAEVFCKVKEYIAPGITTGEIDAYAEKLLRNEKLESKAKGYQGYQHATCISINHEVVHGVPSYDKIIQKGDLVTLDICASRKGWCADMARTWVIGAPANDIQRSLMESACKALDAGIAMAQDGNFLGDVSAAIQSVLDQRGCGIIRDFAGHGIGRYMHEDPDVLNYGTPGTGLKLRPGLVLAIEPMITNGGEKVKFLADGWTAVTEDGSLAVHIEDTVVLTEHGPWVVTDPERRV